MSDANIEGSTSGASPTPSEPRHLRNAVIAWIVVSVIGIVIWLFVSQYVVPPTSSDLGSTQVLTFNVCTILGIPVAMFVFVFLSYSLLFFRVKGRPTEDGPPLRPRPALQISWLAITGVLCLFLFIWGAFFYYQENAVAADPNTLAVNVTAQQWQWTFDYPQYGATSQGAQVIELPVNRPVVFYVTSKDVLHGFSIISFGVRVDANPGYVTQTPQIIPRQTGSYAVRCVEMCGLLHSYMWEEVKVVSQSEFNTWITSQGGHL